MRLGIDIGGTKTAALVLDDAGGIVAQVAAPSGQGNTEVLATAVSVAPGRGAGRRLGAHRTPRGLHARARRPADRLGAARGEPRRPGARPRRRHRGRDWRRPAVDNDVKAAALGAHHAVRPELTDGTTAYLNVGTGLAAAIVHRGQVVRGAGGAAGDERARAVVATLAHGIALAVQVLVVTGAELVVIGGGLARDRLELEAALASDISSRAEASPFLRRLDLGSRIRVLDGDVPVAAIGAALLPGSIEPVAVNA